MVFFFLPKTQWLIWLGRPEIDSILFMDPGTNRRLLHLPAGSPFALFPIIELESNLRVHSLSATADERFHFQSDVDFEVNKLDQDWWRWSGQNWQTIHFHFYSWQPESGLSQEGQEHISFETGRTRFKLPGHSPPLLYGVQAEKKSVLSQTQFGLFCSEGLVSIPLGIWLQNKYPAQELEKLQQIWPTLLSSLQGLALSDSEILVLLKEPLITVLLRLSLFHLAQQAGWRPSVYLLLQRPDVVLFLNHYPDFRTQFLQSKGDPAFTDWLRAGAPPLHPLWLHARNEPRLQSFLDPPRWLSAEEVAFWQNQAQSDTLSNESFEALSFCRFKQGWEVSPAEALRLYRIYQRAQTAPLAQFSFFLMPGSTLQEQLERLQESIRQGPRDKLDLQYWDAELILLVNQIRQSLFENSAQSNWQVSAEVKPQTSELQQLLAVLWQDLQTQLRTPNNAFLAERFPQILVQSEDPLEFLLQSSENEQLRSISDLRQFLLSLNQTFSSAQLEQNPAPSHFCYLNQFLFEVSQLRLEAQAKKTLTTLQKRWEIFTDQQNTIFSEDVRAIFRRLAQWQPGFSELLNQVGFFETWTQALQKMQIQLAELAAELKKLTLPEAKSLLNQVQDFQHTPEVLLLWRQRKQLATAWTYLPSLSLLNQNQYLQWLGISDSDRETQPQPWPVLLQGWQICFDYYLQDSSRKILVARTQDFAATVFQSPEFKHWGLWSIPEVLEYLYQHFGEQVHLNECLQRLQLRLKKLYRLHQLLANGHQPDWLSLMAIPYFRHWLQHLNWQSSEIEALYSARALFTFKELLDISPTGQAHLDELWQTFSSFEYEQTLKNWDQRFEDLAVFLMRAWQRVWIRTHKQEEGLDFRPQYPVDLNYLCQKYLVPANSSTLLLKQLKAEGLYIDT